MRSMTLRMIAVCAVAACITGCTASLRVTNPHGVTSCAGGYAITMPAEWMIVKKGEWVGLSRHGIGMEMIQISRGKTGTPLTHTTLAIDTAMLPHQMAEIVLCDLKATPGIFNASLIELAPAMIAGRSGFRMTATYRVAGGFDKQCCVYGFVDGRWYRQIALYALRGYYYDAAYQDFAAVVESFANK